MLATTEAVGRMERKAAFATYSFVNQGYLVHSCRKTSTRAKAATLYAIVFTFDSENFAAF